MEGGRQLHGTPCPTRHAMPHMASHSPHGTPCPTRHAIPAVQATLQVMPAGGSRGRQLHCKPCQLPPLHVVWRRQPGLLVVIGPRERRVHACTPKHRRPRAQLGPLAVGGPGKLRDLGAVTRT